MKTANFAKSALASTLDPLETLHSQVAKPIIEEAASELGGFLGIRRGLRAAPREIAAEELKRAREKEKLDQEGNWDKENSQRTAQKVAVSIKEEYKSQAKQSDREQTSLKAEFGKLQEEVAKLAEVAGVDTKAHLETPPNKIGVLDIKRLAWIVKYLRIKAEESKSAKELVAQRSNAKRATGMLAWVSGKQMKVHEQGTLMLQG
ncbi:hypothetical protein HYW39_00090 [Candidatus Curtissbacteria bacterium]|nr:hypothetical protein [Candidatus Curtissbacteria bacterium]